MFSNPYFSGDPMKIFSQFFGGEDPFNSFFAGGPSGGGTRIFFGGPGGPHMGGGGPGDEEMFMGGGGGFPHPGMHGGQPRRRVDPPVQHELQVPIQHSLLTFRNSSSFAV